MAAAVRLALAALAIAGTAAAAQAATLTVVVSGVSKDAGRLYIAVCDEATFRGRCRLTAVIPARRGSSRTVFEDVAPGRYAAKVFWDLNDNGKVDVNALGLPSEPYAFSGRKSLAPVFDRAAFAVSQGATTTVVDMSR